MISGDCAANEADRIPDVITYGKKLKKHSKDMNTDRRLPFELHQERGERVAESFDARLLLGVYQ